jgi:hypothetical protein
MHEAVAQPAGAVLKAVRPSSELSAELLVARTIYILHEESQQPVLKDDLVKVLSSAKLAKEEIVCDALDVLFDQGTVRAEWTRDSKKRPVRGLLIAGEAEQFVANLAKRTSL